MSSVSVDPELVEAVWTRIAAQVPARICRLSRAERREAAVELAERAAVESGRCRSRLHQAEAALVALPGETPMGRHARKMRHIRVADRFDERFTRTADLLGSVVGAIDHVEDVKAALGAFRRRRTVVFRRVATRAFLARHPRLAWLGPWLIWRRKGVAA